MKKKQYIEPVFIEFYLDVRTEICQQSKIGINTDDYVDPTVGYDASSHRSSDWDEYER